MKGHVVKVALAMACLMGPWSVGTGALVAQQQPADSFPHLEHQGLFPLCAGCHVGVSEGRIEDAYPEPASCAGCHDGVERAAVAWTPEPLPVSLVDFSHPEHARLVAEDPAAAPGSDPELDCAACHVREGGARLEVVPLSAATCLTCHGDPPEAHFEDATDCATCHRAVAEAETGLSLVAGALVHADAPRPSSHLADTYLAAHAPEPSAAANQCATCHVRERCTSCHVDTDRPALDAVPAAPTAWMLPAMPAAYPTPESHLVTGYDEAHGANIASADDCSTCHTQEDCSTCHIRPLPPVVRALPHRPAPPAADTPVVASAPGVGLTLPAPRSHESPFFMTAHPVLAGTSPEGCGSCHEQSFCTDCHEQPSETGFHPGGFVLRHAPAASSAFQDCASCHSTELFCRQCHVDLGMGSAGRLGGAFHDAEPLFLLRHGTAARRDLEACASCHTQNDCRQCHAQTGAFGVSPHGPDFDAARANEINPWICTACHIGPVGSALGGGDE